MVGEYTHATMVEEFTSRVTMNSIILSIGEELVLGQTVDTNSAYLSRRLAALGLPPGRHVTVSDDQGAIEAAIAALAAEGDVLIISGGLGPTLDDLTRQAIAAVLGVPLEIHAAALEKLAAFFARLNRPMAESNKIQAMIPRGARMIENTCGTAPGVAGVIQTQAPPHSCRFFAMPGVPSEMKAMFEGSVLPELARAASGAALVSRTLHTFGVGESNLGQTITALMRRGRNPSVGTTVANSQVSVRIYAHFPSVEQAQAELDKTTAACRELLGDLIFGQDEQTLAGVVAQMLTAGQTLAVAESGSDGALARMIGEIPRSGEFFHYGWIAVSDNAKKALLHVAANLIREFGPTSEPVAAAMAASARRISSSTFAMALSGNPDAAGDERFLPGTFAIALAHPAGVQTRSFRFSGEREILRDRAAKMALTMLRFYLLGKAMPF